MTTQDRHVILIHDPHDASYLILGRDRELVDPSEISRHDTHQDERTAWERSHNNPKATIVSVIECITCGYWVLKSEAVDEVSCSEVCARSLERWEEERMQEDAADRQREALRYEGAA